MSIEYKIDPVKKAVAETIYIAMTKLYADGGELDFSRRDLFGYLEKPPELKMGDFALPCFRFSKAFKKKPFDIAGEIVAELNSQESEWIKESCISGPFLNVFIRKEKLAAIVLPQVQSGEFFEVIKSDPDNNAQKVMIEFSQPNTHKQLHVGHGRNMCLGDSIVRLFRYCGYSTIAANYPGDEGTHIAKCLWYMKKNNAEAPAENRGAWLGDLYAEASRCLADADESTKKQYDVEVSEVLKAIESKEGPTYELWKETRQWSLDLFYSIYDWMDIHFDEYFFESEVSEESQLIVDEYLSKGVFIEDAGAVGSDLNEQKLGFMLVRKRDGNTLYATKDLVLARRKFDQFKVDRSIYVVGSEQNLHFKQVFKTLELMGFEKAADCFHLSYGHVRLPEGKMSSRAGKVVSFQGLCGILNKELTKNLEKYKDKWSAAELEETRDRLAIGAIKYGMLSTDPVKDVVFNAEDWVSFEGDTGPYLMYSYARTQSIIRRAAEVGVVPNAEHLELLTHETELEILRKIYDFNDVVFQACRLYKPSHLSHNLYEFCKSFNRFYSKVSVLKAESPELMQARTNLLDCFSEVLKQGLSLLGITPPERM